MENDPKKLIETSPMSAMQIIAIGICVLLNALDGFDVLAISFSAPGIATEWGVDRAALGVVLSMELIGMAFGSILIGGIADKYGRRPAILFCQVLMATGMLLAALAHGVYDLSAYRFATGLGIGGMLSSVSAMAAEYANSRNKSLAVSFMAGGFPVGVIVGGSFASYLLDLYSWRSIFYFGAGMTAAFMVLVWFLLPESISYLVRQRPANALAKINAILKRMKRPTLQELPEDASVPANSRTVSFATLFSSELRLVTILLAVAYFCHVMTHYFYFKWVPKIVVDMGYAASEAGSILVWANVGGLVAAFVMGLLSQRISMRIMTIFVLFGTTASVMMFGGFVDTYLQLQVVAIFAGFFTSGAVVGFYALFATSYPTRVRARGAGFILGLGRGGSVIGPISAGLLFSLGFNLQYTAAVMACGSLLGGIALLFLKTGNAVAEKERNPVRPCLPASKA
ncbi:MAG: MFS transporter [Desulfopila sp.]